MIKLAKLEDITEIEKIMRKSYYKFDLDKFHQNYDKDTVIEKLAEFITNDFYRVCIDMDSSGKLSGVLIVVLFPSLFDKKNMQIHDITIQPNPDMPEISQAKILIKLINHMLSVGKEIEAKAIAITINPAFNISNYLLNKGFVNSDNIYTKGVM